MSDTHKICSIAEFIKAIKNKWILLLISLVLLTACNKSQEKDTSAFKVYEHESPAFTVTYPSNLIERPLNKKLIFGQNVQRAISYLHVVSFTVWIQDIPKGIPLEGAAFFYGELLKKANHPIDPKYKIRSREINKVNDGTKALDFVIDWKNEKKMQFHSSFRVAYKGNKAVAIIASAHPLHEPIWYLKKITYSLQFK